jgi:hypothetical protein
MMIEIGTKKEIQKMTRQEKRLAMQTETGWQWVFSRLMPNCTVTFTNDKRQALKPRDLDFFRNEFGNSIFELRENL